MTETALAIQLSTSEDKFFNDSHHLHEKEGQNNRGCYFKDHLPGPCYLHAGTVVGSVKDVVSPSPPLCFLVGEQLVQAAVFSQVSKVLYHGRRTKEGKRNRA